MVRKDNEGIIPVLARSVREVEQAAERGRVAPHGRATFQVVALLVRDERQRLHADTELGESRKAEQLKRLDGIATILAKAAARDTTLLQLLAEDAAVSEGAKALKRQMLKSAGIEVPEEVEAPKPDTAASSSARRITPQSVISRQLANPFLVPDFSAAEGNRVLGGRLANWELLEPLFKSFEYVGGGAAVRSDVHIVNIDPGGAAGGLSNLEANAAALVDGERRRLQAGGGGRHGGAHFGVGAARGG